MKSFIFLCALLLGSVSHAEIFRVNVQGEAIRDCAIDDPRSCTREYIDIGNLDLDVTRGFQIWTQTVNFDGIDYRFDLFVAKLGIGFKVFSSASVSFGGASTTSNGFVETIDDQSLPTSGSFTSYLPTGATMSGALITVSKAK